MFAYEPPLDPPCDEWRDYTLPLLCEMRLREVCKDILSTGARTRFQHIYDAIFELIEADVETEHMEGLYE